MRPEITIGTTIKPVTRQHHISPHHRSQPYLVGGTKHKLELMRVLLDKYLGEQICTVQVEVKLALRTAQTKGTACRTAGIKRIGTARVCRGAGGRAKE